MFKHVSKRFFKQGTRTFKELLHRLVLHRESPGQFVHALSDLSFTINPGESVGIIGKNGSGKSTLLKLIAGVTSPTKGTVSVLGRIAPLIELGAGFHPDLTGRENMYINAAMLGMTKAEVQAKAEEIIAFAELSDFLDTPIKHYSSGMYLRLAFSVAVHVNADILLIDEILAVGDEPFQQKCLAKLREFQTSGKTIIFVSHNIQSVLDFCNRAIYLEHGKVVIDAPVEKTVRHYSLDMERSP